MYYPDLAPCPAVPESRFRVVPFAVGWLDSHHPYPRGTAPDAVLERLWALCNDPPIMSLGIHRCEFCQNEKCVRSEVAYRGATMAVGSCAIIIMGTRGNVYYAPDMIMHYILDHAYLPPTEFLEAVLQCPLPDSTQYRKKLNGLRRRSLQERVREGMVEARKLVGLGPADPPSYEDKLAGRYVDHQSPVALREHAGVLKDAGRGDEAIQYLDKALQLDNHDALAHYMRGHTLHWFGKSEEAIPNLERAAELYAQQGPAQFYQEAKARWFLGRLLFELGDEEAARRSLQQAADLHRSYGRAFDANAVLKDIDALTGGTLDVLFRPFPRD